MNWSEFAKHIKGELKDNSDGFIGGTIEEKEISKTFEGGGLRIKKRVRRVYEASSHFGVEQFEMEYRLVGVDFGRLRLRRKNVLKRLGKSRENQYLLDGVSSKNIKNILPSEALKYLLQYPKSEFILLNNTIKFKAQSLGIMGEELERIYTDVTELKQILLVE